MRKILVNMILLVTTMHIMPSTHAPCTPIAQPDTDLIQQLARALQSKGSIIFIQNSLQNGSLQNGPQHGSSQHGSSQHGSQSGNQTASIPHANPITPSTPIAHHPSTLHTNHEHQARIAPSSGQSSLGLPISPTKLGVGASCIAALAAWLKMKLLANTVLRSGSWASWHSDIPCEVLMQLSDEEIIAELWPSLRDHYSIEEEPVDAFKIMQFFLNDLEHERVELEKLLWWHNFMHKIGLGNFVNNAPLANKARQRCQRLDLLEDCVHEWVNKCLCKGGIFNESTTSS